MDTLKKWSSSWLIILLALIFFWPLGLVLLFIRIQDTRGNLKSLSNIFWTLAIICYFITFLGITQTVGNKYNDSASISALTFFCIASIGFTIPAIKFHKKYKYYKNYADYIKLRRRVSIDEIAKKMGETTEKVTQNIAKIISYKMLDGYINEENEVVLIDNYSNTPSYIGNVTTNATPQRQVLTVKCRNCGATNKFITGKENRCEYCDSLLTK